MTETHPGKPGPTLLFWLVIVALAVAALLFVPLSVYLLQVGG